MPYRLIHPDARATADGIRGECWITPPRGRQRRARLMQLVRDLCGREVSMMVRPVHYAFESRAAHNVGSRVVGVRLQFELGLEAVC